MFWTLLGALTRIIVFAFVPFVGGKLKERLVHRKMYSSWNLLFRILQCRVLFSFSRTLYQCVYGCDLKFNSIATGLSSHPSRHPCPYCTSKSAHWDEQATLQTSKLKFGSLPSVEENFRNENREQIVFHCLNPPLLYSNQPILLFCPPPTLHIKLGIVNLLVQHLFSLHPHLEVKVAEA